MIRISVDRHSCFAGPLGRTWTCPECQNTGMIAAASPCACPIGETTREVHRMDSAGEPPLKRWQVFDLLRRFEKRRCAGKVPQR